MATPAADPAADTATITWQLDKSQITGDSTITYPWSSSVFRYEGPPLMESTVPNDENGLIPDPTVRVHFFRVAFTCDCQQFEFVIQSRGSNYRLWVDGSWTTADFVAQQNNYHHKAFYKVQFPDKRPRQIKVGIDYGAPFFGVVTSGQDTISAPQTPLGPKVVLFGDSWIAPTITDAVLPQYQGQPGVHGSGFGQILGEYFNWNYSESGLGGSGFVKPGAYPPYQTFVQREQTDLCYPNPEMAVVVGGVNDGGQPEADVQQAATQFISQFQNCLPNEQMFLLGPQALETTVEPALAAAASQFSNVFYKDPAAENWLYGSSTDPSTGNYYLYMNAHPTALGHDFYAEKITAYLMNTMPSLVPQTFPLFEPTSASGSFSYSVAAGSLVPAGQNQIVVTFTPQDNTNYATVTQNAVLTVTKASSSVAVTSSALSIAPGKALALTATVSPQIGGIPTGTVTFLDNGTPIGSAALDSSGSAAFSTSSLSVGTHLLSAAYAGDGNFYGSSTASAISIVVAKPDFSMSVSGTQVTVVPGQSSTLSLTVTPMAGLSANLNLSCSGLPANASCSLQNTQQIVVNQQPVTVNVIIQAFALKTALNHSASMFGGGIEFCGLFGLLFILKRRNRTALSRLTASVLLLIAGLSFVSGCGSNSKFKTAEPGTYSVDITLTSASDASLTHSQAITVVIP